MSRTVMVFFCLLAVGLPLFGQADAKPKLVAEKNVRTEHSVTIGGQKISYVADAGTLPIKAEDGKVTANIFFVSYTRPAKDLATRPITFCFNGGPGSSSVWLHLGAFGPRRVQLTPKGEAPAPPGRVVENADSILDVTDLVFIDPVSTGYSRAADAKDAKQFHGVEEDIRSVGEFIRLYMTREGRWESPRFLAGESYGTTRAANLVNHMQNRYGMYFNGVVLLSTVLNFETLIFNEGNDLPYILFLPSYTATAYFHNRLGARNGTLAEVVQQAKAFAEGPYTVALMKGSQISDDEAAAVAKQMAELTGLSEAYIRKSHLRVEAQHFMAELLRDKGLVIGRFDSRITGMAGKRIEERPEYDPSYTAVQGPFTDALNDYMRRVLDFRSDLTYEILTSRVQPWNYANAATNRYLNVAPALREALTKNPHLRVFQGSGYYDLATPLLATDYTFSHLGGSKELTSRVTTAYYEGGHMMYTHLPSLRKLHADVTTFIQGK